MRIVVNKHWRVYHVLGHTGINRRCKHEHDVTRNSLFKGLSAFKTYINIGFQTERFPKWVKKIYLLEI